MTRQTHHHRHRAIAARRWTRGWTACVADDPSRCSGAAHGAVVDIDKCSCGATRRTEINGLYRVRGPWAADADC